MARIGIIGTGWGARVQVPAFREAGLDVVAIAGRDREKTQRVATDLGLKAVNDWRALIAHPAIDLLSIVTPPAQHLEMASASLEGGKHVLTEKPTALNGEQARQLLAVARRHPDRLSLIDHELRFLPAWRAARERIADIAPVWHAAVHYSSPSRRDRNRPWNWWSDVEQGGGIWAAVGSHYVDAVRYLIGEIEAVQATLHTFIAERPDGTGMRAVTADDFAAVNLRVGKRILVTMTFSVIAGVDEPTTLTIHGERGSLRLVGEELLFAPPAGAFERRAGESLAKRVGNSAGGAFGSGTVYLGQALRAALDQGKSDALAPAATFGDGLAQQTVLDAAHRSSRDRGRWLSLEGSS